MNARYGCCRSPSAVFGPWLLPLVFPLRQQLDFSYRHLPQTTGSLIDIGCGNGVFLLREKAAGWEVVGLEPDPVVAVGVRACGLDVHGSTLDTFDRVDVAAASHVIDHVHEPKVYLPQRHRFLAAGGSIWLATPNARSTSHRVFGRAWRELELLRHITVFSARVLRTLLASADLEDDHFRRRGCSAGYTLGASRKLVRLERNRLSSLLIAFVSLCANFSAIAGKELVVTARKSSP